MARSDSSGVELGSTSLECARSTGLKLELAGTDNASGLASLSYASSGAQSIPSTTLNAITAEVSITAPGMTTLTASATDVAGNVAPKQSEAVFVASGFGCAGPTPGFNLPQHGTVVLTGTATINGQSIPFHDTIHF
ncbi:MAG: hypothetical protein JOZ81_08455 [Chloroflexi bacterium]|nr:hypothetical protein [Chloroflexota bacterium]